MSRRGLLVGSAAIAAGFAPEGARGAPGAAASSLGEWTDTPLGLPAYRYTGPLTFGGGPMLPDDPWFLLGNHRLTVFAHASGRLRWRSGERGWAAMNGLAGDNAAALVVEGRRTELVGVASAAAAGADKLFAVGAAQFRYPVAGGVQSSRTLSVRPSAKVGAGAPALLVTVELRNGAAHPLAVGYEEAIAAHYAPVAPPWVHDEGRIAWRRSAAVAPLGTARFDFAASPREPLLLPPRPHMAEFDAEPPSFWMVAGEGGCAASAEADGRLHARWSGTLQPGETRRLRFVIGHAFARDGDPARIAAAMTPAHAADLHHADEWARLLPAFERESEAAFRRELRWNAGALEAMATWREYYDETVVPQGTTYDYEWGMLASSRDLAQHALPLCTLRPALARSVIRYILKRTVADGEIKLNDQGFGWSAHGPMLTSDQQLYLFMLVAEYLRATGDARILDEVVPFYPAETGGGASGLDHLARAFQFLRDQIGTGAHGLVRLWNSDWNDLFYHWTTPLPYNEMFADSESHMNTAMAVVVLGDLAAALAATGRPDATALGEAMTAYRARLLAAFLADLGGRDFPRRAYLGRAGAVGEDAMWLEPQGFTLLMPELPQGKRQTLHTAVRTRLGAHEALGARQLESGPTQGELKLGQRENGGFWYALNGPLVLGLARLDPQAARAALRRMGFANYAARFPHYWTGAWTASDSLDASTVATQGLSAMAPWCAHAHAWPLHLWLKLNEQL